MTKRWTQKFMAALLAVSVLSQAMVIPAPAATVQEETRVKAENLIPGSPWTDTNILGNLPASVPGERDDFNTACNYTWLSAQTEIPTGYDKYGIREELEEENKRKLMSVMEQKTHASQEERLISGLYAAALDMDTRNAAGMGPILPYLEKIRNIETLDEMTAYLCSSEFHIEDPLIEIYQKIDIRDPSRHMVLLLPSLGDFTTAAEAADASDSPYAGFMQRAEIPAGETAAANQAAMNLGLEIDEATLSDLHQSSKVHENLLGWYHPFTADELRSEFPSFPLADIMKSRGLTESVTVSLISVNGFKKLDELYRSENLEGFKGALIQKIFDSMMSCLDGESLNDYDAICQAVLANPPSTDPRERAYSLCGEYLSEPMGKVFVEHTVTPEVKSDVQNLVEDIRTAFRKRIQNSDWMTEETRAKALDKLDSIRVRAACADKWRDYSGLVLSGGGKKGVLADYVIEIKKYKSGMERRELNLPVNGDYWPGDSMNVYSVGAFYSPQDNSINIPAGILGGVFYKKDGSVEERYFSVGTIIGHEFTHGFDPSGSYFDKYGGINDWWSPEDRAAYKERQAQVEAYYSSIMAKPEEYVDGELTIGESVADMGGVSLLLDVMKEKGNVDYRKAFCTYAALWPEVETSEMASDLLQEDEHPPKYVRVNAVVQQFQEFYDAFQVKEGDGMYLAPEKRVGIWR